MEDEKIKITNTADHRVGVNVPELRFNRKWASKGSSVKISRSIVEELLYDPGFRYMIDNGILYIEDLATKKELELEPEDVKAPKNIIVLTDGQKKNYLTTMSLKAFKEKVETLSDEQVNALADFAIEHNYLDVDKNKILKQRTGKDILQAVRLKEE